MPRARSDHLVICAGVVWRRRRRKGTSRGERKPLSWWWAGSSRGRRADRWRRGDVVGVAADPGDVLPPLPLVRRHHARSDDHYGRHRAGAGAEGTGDLGRGPAGAESRVVWLQRPVHRMRNRCPRPCWSADKVLGPAVCRTCTPSLPLATNSWPTASRDPSRRHVTIARVHRPTRPSPRSRDGDETAPCPETGCPPRVRVATEEDSSATTTTGVETRARTTTPRTGEPAAAGPASPTGALSRVGGDLGAAPQAHLRGADGHRDSGHRGLRGDLSGLPRSVIVSSD